MPLRSRSLPLTAVLALSATLLTWVGPANGQTSGGLQMLQGLSPQQREALARQLGGLGNTGTQGALGTLGGRQQQADEEMLNITQQQQRELLMDEEKERAEFQRLSPFLQGEDWLVITIDSNPPSLLSLRRRPRRRRVRWRVSRICHRALSQHCGPDWARRPA